MMHTRVFLFTLIGALMAAGAAGKSLMAGDDIVLDIPDGWTYSDTSDVGDLHVFSFGLNRIDQHVAMPVGLAKPAKGFTPDPVRGISIAIGKPGLAYVILEAKPVEVTIGGKVIKSYRRDSDGVLTVSIPDGLLAARKGIPVLVTVSATNQAELDSFLRVAETVHRTTPGASE
jgi:hypothetical protein